MSALLKVLAGIIRPGGGSHVMQPGAGSLTLTGLVPVAGLFTYQLPATEVINSNASEGDQCNAEYRFNTDGTIQEQRESLGTNPVSTSASSPWSDDPGETGAGKYVRMGNANTGTNRRSDALGTGFIEITSQRVYQFTNVNTAGPFTDASIYTVDISLDGSTVHDTQELTVNLDNEGP